MPKNTLMSEKEGWVEERRGRRGREGDLSSLPARGLSRLQCPGALVNHELLQLGVWICVQMCACLLPLL